jgi:predicted deacylase
MARQHAGETPGSWVLDGIMRSLSEDGLGGIDWWIVPFVDLDGVENGDYGKDAHPWDFNRAWEQMPMRPEVLSIQADLRRFKARYPKRLVIDLHAPGHAEDGLWVFMPRSHRPPEQRAVSESMVSALAGVFTEVGPSELRRETDYASRWGMDATATSWAWDHLDRTPAASIETSYQSLAGKGLDIDGYREIGRRLVSVIGAHLA